MRVLSIVNPAAGRARDRNVSGAIADALSGRAEIADRRVEAADDAARWARGADREGFDLVVAAGGDGTVGQVAAGLIACRSSIPMAIVPLGTANILASAAGIPADPDKALDLLRTGVPVSFDAGQLVDRNRFFLISAGVGHPGRVMAAADGRLKSRFGMLAYVIAAVRDLRRLRNERFEVESDGELHVLGAHSLLVINFGDLGWMGLTLGPSDPQDGMLEIGAIRSPSVAGYALALHDLIRRRHYGSRHLRYLRGRRFTIRTARPVPVEVDGDPAGTTPVTVQVIPQAVRILVPAGSSSRTGAEERAVRIGS